MAQFLVLFLVVASPSVPWSAAQSTVRVSEPPHPMKLNGASRHPRISADGRYVAFESYASSLVPNDTNGEKDIFVWDRMHESIERVSISESGEQANASCSRPGISAGGRYVTFESKATNLVAVGQDERGEIVVRDRLTGENEYVDLNANGDPAETSAWGPSISANGRYVAFSSSASNLVSGDTNRITDVFVRDRKTRTTERVSVGANGVEANDPSRFGSISEDGRFVVFQSWEDDLDPRDNNDQYDVYLHDRLTKVTEIVSIGNSGSPSLSGAHGWPEISADGRFVIFDAGPDLVPGAAAIYDQIYIRDRLQGVTELMTVSPGGNPGNGMTWPGCFSISAQGEYVSFYSAADNLVAVDLNQYWDTFVRRRGTGPTELASVDSQGRQAERHGAPTDNPSLSADGRFVAFTSFEDGLDPPSVKDELAVYLRDRGPGSAARHGTIVLAAPFEAASGSPLEVSWYAAPRRGVFLLGASLSRSGSRVGGHPVDLGRPVLQLHFGPNAPDGSGSVTLGPLPMVLAGRRLFLELIAQDGSGRVHDSNVIELHVR